MTSEFEIGDQFVKEGGDYTFIGEVRGIITKKSGKVRIVGENRDGLLFIFNPEAIRKI